MEVFVLFSKKKNYFNEGQTLDTVNTFPLSGWCCIDLSIHFLCLVGVVLICLLIFTCLICRSIFTCLVGVALICISIFTLAGWCCIDLSINISFGWLLLYWSVYQYISFDWLVLYWSVYLSVLICLPIFTCLYLYYSTFLSLHLFVNRGNVSFYLFFTLKLWGGVIFLAPNVNFTILALDVLS